MGSGPSVEQKGNDERREVEHVLRIDWDAIRAYASLFVLTLIALIAVWKDSKDYANRAREVEASRIKRFLKRRAVIFIYAITLLLAILGAFDIHARRHQALQDAAMAKAENASSREQIQDLQASVKAGNDLLAQQRQDFLRQFSEMSERVSGLQTAMRTADLQTEAERLRSDLEATRKAMEVQKATLSFSFVPDDGSVTHFLSLNLVDGVVRVPFTVLNATDADALEGSIDLKACDGCKIVGNPDGYTRLNGEPEN